MYEFSLNDDLFPTTSPLHISLEGIKYLIFRTLLQWCGVSSLYLLGLCSSSAPEDSIIHINYTIFLFYSLYTHKLLLLPEEF